MFLGSTCSRAYSFRSVNLSIYQAKIIVYYKFIARVFEFLRIVKKCGLINYKNMINEGLAIFIDA